MILYEILKCDYEQLRRISYSLSSAMHAAVLLQNGKKIAVPRQWVQTKKRNRETIVFLSKDKKKKPDFSINVRYFTSHEDSCHNGIYFGTFGK